LRSLYLQGLDSQAEEIFQEYSLKNQEKWSELITLYQGHPSWLNIITSTIVELFNGDVSLFLEQMQDEIYLGDIETLIESHLSQSQFLAAIQSLMRRCLVDKLPSETSSYFPINPVFKSYLKRNSHY